jgi:phosphohistidine phosphatase
MKTLLILRHAKTQPDAPQGDWARELKQRGHRDAAAIGAYLLPEVGTPNAIVTSDAQRARQTAEIIATELGFDRPLVIEPRIYSAAVEMLLDVVRQLPNEAETVILVGHNPGFEELAASLSGRDDDDVRLPTAAVARLEFDLPRWSDVRPGTGAWRGITSPRSLREK